MTTQPVECKRTINAAPAAVYRAFTRATPLREWLCDAAMADARVGGRLYLWWNSGYYAAGEFTAVQANHRIAFTWLGKGEPGQTQVEVTLAAAGDGAEVTLTHGGFGEGEAWRQARQASVDGWSAGLENLASLLETGEDLRLIRRPMLGVYVDDFDVHIAARLGVPVSEGMRLSGVIEGMGAQRAGLQKDDVIVGVGDMRVTSWAGVATTMQGRQAGDVIPVVFYRGAARLTVSMELSQRPMLEAPATPQALAAALQKMYAELDPELACCFDAVSDAEALRQPAAGEWSALQTVAHLIITERDWQSWISELINDDERWSDHFDSTANIPARLGALVAVYPTVLAMLAALQRSTAETTATVAALPPEFVARRGSYLRLARALMPAAEHWREHIEQIRAAIQAAREP
jgi:uncharacterized protein YndB with AHSA1/START domain